jgi:transcription antitermination factor NusG
MLSLYLCKTGFPTGAGEAMSGSYEDANCKACDEPVEAPRWFAAYTATHHEKRVHEYLRGRNVESFLPVYSSRRNWKKRAPTTVHLPLFPNYVFVRISRCERTAVLSAPGVFLIVGSGPNLWELPEHEIEALRNGMRVCRIEPHEYLVVGERARVKSGIFEGVEGVIVRKNNNLQIVLTLDQIMRSVAIEVNAEELELISHSHYAVGDRDRRPRADRPQVYQTLIPRVDYEGV